MPIRTPNKATTYISYELILNGDRHIIFLISGKKFDKNMKLLWILKITEVKLIFTQYNIRIILYC